MSQQSQTSEKSKPFSIRFTDAERSKLTARSGGMPLGAYIKSCCLSVDAPRHHKRRPMPKADQRLLAEILARLGASRLPQNLNQIAKHAHLGTLLLDDDLTADLQQACAEVAWMRTQLMAALGLKNAEPCPCAKASRD